LDIDHTRDGSGLAEFTPLPASRFTGNLQPMSPKFCSAADTKHDLRVLIAESDRSSRETLHERISSWGFQVRAVEGIEVLKQVQTFEPDVLLIDFGGQEKSAAEYVRELHAQGFDIPVIVMAEETDFAAAIRSTKSEAYDFLSKPINSSHLLLVLSNLATQLSVAEENQRLRRKLIETGTLGPIIGNSPAMRSVMRLIEEAADSSISALILGENGTGKKLAARTIHQFSTRRDGPYAEVTCAAVPNNLMESELWGHERNAFAGADSRREGFLAMTAGGTLLLNEITELGIELQARLLRTLEDKRIRRMGGSSETEIPLDVRLIAASSRSPAEATHHGRLREDLYSRLNSLTIELPPLRDRIEDIPALVEAFIKQSADSHRKPVTGIDNECLEILRANRWPGNVLQLRNVIERATIVARRPLLAPPDLPNDIRRAGRKGPHFELRIGETMDEIERELIFKTLDFTNGNKVRAAQMLGISLKTLYNRLVRYQGKDRDSATEPSRNHDN
jgi:DNA-binding NtrC family response regulator